MAFQFRFCISATAARRLNSGRWAVGCKARVGITTVQSKGFTDPYLSLPPGDYNLKITTAGSSCATTYLDLPSIRLAKGDITDVFAIGDIDDQALAYASATGLNPTTPPMVNVAHFASFANSVDGTSVTVRVDGKDALTDFKFGQMIDYLSFTPGEHKIEVLPTGTNTVDICTDDGVVVTGLAGVPYKGVTDPYLELPAGTYDLKVTAAGSNCGTTYLDLDPVTLADGNIVSVFAIGDIANLPLQIAVSAK